MSQESNFSKFGKSFQEDLCHMVLNDRPFADQMFEVLDLDFLELKHLRVFIQKIEEYRKKYGVHPTSNIMHSIIRTGLDGEPAGNFRHRRQQRQAAALVGHRLVGDGRHAGCEQPLGLLRVGRQMKIGVEDLPLAQLRPFLWLRLLDLDDHVRPFEDLAGRADDPGAGSHIGAVVCADPGAGLRLDQHLMACATYSRTAPGVRPTRYSWFLISFGHPTRMQRSSPLMAFRQLF